MTRVHVLKVFVGPDGRGGNGLGVVVDGGSVPEGERQALAADLGFAETVFVDDPWTGAVRIFTPARELGFAGHPTVGTAWLLERLGHPADILRPPAGDVLAWRDGDGSWVRARATWVHAMTLVELGSAADVEALEGPPAGDPSWYAWAWIDEDAGILRSRYFFTGAGIAEDEATGAAAVKIGDLLGRTLEIRQGVGSVIHVRPGPDGTVDIGGRVENVEIRELV